MIFRGVVRIIVGAVVPEAVGKVILTEVRELRRTSGARIVNGVDAADQIAPMIGGAAGAAAAIMIVQKIIVDSGAVSEGLLPVCRSSPGRLPDPSSSVP